MFSNSRWLYFILVALAAITIIISAVCGAVELKDVSAALLALLGTFIGALFAFRLDENKDAVKSEREKKENLNKALFILVRQFNAIKQISRDLSKYKADFERAFNLPAFQPPSYFDLKQSIESLSFLLSSSEPSILLELSVEQERFEQAIESIRVRNNFYVAEVQPAISQSQLNGAKVTSEQIRSVIGDRLFRGAMEGVKTVYDHVTTCESSIPEMHGKLLKVAKSLYPKDGFISFENNA